MTPLRRAEIRSTIGLAFIVEDCLDGRVVLHDSILDGTFIKLIDEAFDSAKTFPVVVMYSLESAILGLLTIADQARGLEEHSDVIAYAPRHSGVRTAAISAP